MAVSGGDDCGVLKVQYHNMEGCWEIMQPLAGQEAMNLCEVHCVTETIIQKDFTLNLV